MPTAEPKRGLTPQQIERFRTFVRPDEKPPVRVTEFAPASLPGRAGYIVAVNDDGIVLRAAGTKEITTYPLHDALAAGRLQRHAMAAYGYLASDLEVGDRVVLSLCEDDGAKYCAEIRIVKRAGGRVPESRTVGERKPTYATQQNARNDFQDHGIRIPADALHPTITPEQLEEYRKMVEQLRDDLQKLKDR